MLSIRVVKRIYRQCVDDSCPQIAASLAYATLLALIPITVLIYKIYATVFVSPDLQLKAQAFIFESLTPSTVKQVQQYLVDSAVHANSLNIFGLLMLLISVVVMMYTIDSALNGIWKIKLPRYLIRRFFVYIALLIFGPLAISFSIFAGTYVASLSLITTLLGKTINSGVIVWLPFLVSWVAFTMLYKWVPDCKVRWLHAFTGATFAVILFEIAKSGFTLYLSYFNTYELLYGALASIPLLLIWIYFTWLIVLIGAEIAHFMQVDELK